MSLGLLDPLGSTEPLAEVFSDRSVLAAMLRFEVALARAQAVAGIIPDAVAEAIAGAAVPEAFDSSELARVARTGGTIAIPLVAILTVRVRADSPDAAAFVHRGATSQDVTDTALVLCLVQAARILMADHQQLLEALRRLSNDHRDSVMLGRTLLQPAIPTTFGLKAAGWFAALSRGGKHLTQAFEEACVLQFGGACGTLAALGADGLTVSRALARELDLPEPDAPWHTHRDRLARLVTASAIYTGTLGKIARDVSLLMQYEVAEVVEPGGGSSTMPHKRNPAACAVVLAAATRVPGLAAAFLASMPQEHERGIGNWHGEAATLSAAVQATGSALAAMVSIGRGLRVDHVRMRANIGATAGMVYAEGAMMLLAPLLGRESAQRAIQAALEETRRTGRDFVAALRGDTQVLAALDPGVLASLDRPEEYLGAAEQFRRRLLGESID